MVLKRFPAAGLWLRKISNNLQNLRFGKNCRLTKKTLMIWFSGFYQNLRNANFLVLIENADHFSEVTVGLFKTHSLYDRKKCSYKEMNLELLHMIRWDSRFWSENLSNKDFANCCRPEISENSRFFIFFRVNEDFAIYADYTLMQITYDIFTPQYYPVFRRGWLFL